MSDISKSYGGAIYVSENSDLQFNVSTDGVKRRIFTGNRALANGAAIFIQDSIAVINDIQIYEHSGVTAVKLDLAYNVILQNALMYNNISPGSGGVFDCQSCQDSRIENVEAY